MEMCSREPRSLCRVRAGGLARGTETFAPQPDTSEECEITKMLPARLFGSELSRPSRPWQQPSAPVRHALQSFSGVCVELPLVVWGGLGGRP